MRLEIWIRLISRYRGILKYLNRIKRSAQAISTQAFYRLSTHLSLNINSLRNKKGPTFKFQFSVKSTFHSHFRNLVENAWIAWLDRAFKHKGKRRNKFVDGGGVGVYLHRLFSFILHISCSQHISETDYMLLKVPSRDKARKKILNGSCS